MAEHLSIYDKALQATQYVQSKIQQPPEIGLILGSGLGEFADEIEDKVYIPFGDIPHFKKSTVAGHAGKLVVGKVGNKTVCCMQGRYHYYEGHTMQEVVFPIRVLKLLGIKKLVVTNAAGGISKMINCGDLMIIRDHINLMGSNPLFGQNDERFGPRFPDMSEVFNKELSDVVAKHMKNLGIGVKKGVYVAFTGPSYETPAEISMAKTAGGDAAGMSTVPECITANHMGIKVVGISCVTNMAAGVTEFKLNHQDVIDTANYVKSCFKQLLKNCIPDL
ncbi:purine nucleoside phosphorylase, putative [Ichthyophthirius multifiliis]|uniref:Purine nucleoside phosphorylase n=1 Tax=Ichthyophthirius multifiliis TaxID=5932 RepID=G0QUC3_ICHMU|nr:purine nucleoside phosphorylase, putative [Ichthyophthirius multifiliis]EGR31195.1 purine nucleoside phosphorylase, putative [Ichthyophthirius multifiliis]|eukprot:XP_004034681.1 purine nucleoside phosphorylase, putative [Ichthyophthirius multifiliis]